MANDHINLICRSCGESMSLGKYYPSVILQVDSVGDNQIQAFINKHLKSCFDAGSDEAAEFDLGYFEMFVIGGDALLP